MTLNGWLQILFFLLAIFLVTPVIGAYMARVFTGQRTWLDLILRPVERLTYRLTGVDEARGMRWTDNAVAVLLFGVVSMLVLYVMQRLQQLLPLNPQGFGAGRAGARVQHRRVVHDQHQLAGLWRRNDHELFHADGRPRLPQLRPGRRWHLCCHRVHPRHRPEGARTIGNFWVDLMRACLGAAADLHRGVAVAGVAGRGAEPEGRRQAR